MQDLRQLPQKKISTGRSFGGLRRGGSALIQENAHRLVDAVAARLTVRDFERIQVQLAPVLG
jgi:hypothetical protein